MVTWREYKKGAGAGITADCAREKELFLLGRSGSAETFLGQLAGAKAAGELLDATSGIDKFLLAGEKGMAGGANAEADILLGGACMIDRAAGADDLAFHVFGVDIGFHGSRETYLNLSGEQASILLNGWPGPYRESC